VEYLLFINISDPLLVAKRARTQASMRLKISPKVNQSTCRGASPTFFFLSFFSFLFFFFVAKIKDLSLSNYSVNMVLKGYTVTKLRK
jgi:hypothetical protein